MQGQDRVTLKAELGVTLVQAKGQHDCQQTTRSQERAMVPPLPSEGTSPVGPDLRRPASRTTRQYISAV